MLRWLKAPLVMVVDHQRTAIMENAHLVLSAASFAESDGTVINNEGRANVSSRFTIRLITTAKLSCWKAGVGYTRCTAPC
ncbi:NADH-quinone oxidoreductase subunit G [Escherichia coli]|uniref:NADH-quinone oxidoreductase subunit G n=1 Tax=Escherichia coli TaxID=562 RepID=A0A376L826_ECOLX|nr:NADH-quinone oxidoreductase subunit G [Escherichia coli]